MKTALWGGTALCLALAGCATTYNEPSKDPEGLKPGNVALAVGRFDPAPTVATYAERAFAQRESKAGAWAGTGAKSGGAVVIHASIRMPLLLPLLPALVPIGVLSGAVIGAGAGAMSSAWDAARTPTVARAHALPLRALLAHSLQEQPPHAALATQFMELVEDQRAFRFSVEPDAGPRTTDDMPDYRALKGRGFDTVLEFAVTRVGLLATAEEDPSLSLELDLRARVISLRTGGAPWVREWTHRSAQRTVVEWQAEEGLLVRNELDGAYRAVAKLAIDAALSP